jgi:hypothetical protein
MKTTWNHTPQAHAVFVAGWAWLALWTPVMACLLIRPDLATALNTPTQVIACLVVVPLLTLPIILAITWSIYAHSTRK